MESPAPKQGRVLPTLNQDGSRVRIRPQLFKGRTYKQRLWVAWGLVILFASLPFLKINGRPAVLLDLAAREFTFFGVTFFATEGVLLMLLMLSIFVGIVALTAVMGRAWCGWGCPQTVYMEFIFRPIERLFEGDRNAQLQLDKNGGGLRRVGKNIVYAVLAVIVANIFLAYFVGADTLFQWMKSSPAEQPVGFLVMGITAGLVFFDFAYFREQMCTVICPYARLQAALFDKDSLIIGYNEQRGEPRKKGKLRDGAGDCVACDACVRTCPTGIDIRQGLQLECIACAQCVDACDTVMSRVGLPPHLISYASQRTLQGGKKKIVRGRVIAYGALLTVLLTALTVLANGRRDADVTVLRGIGAPYVLEGNGVRNQLRLKIENHTEKSEAYSYQLEIENSGKFQAAAALGITVISPENPLRVEARGRSTTSLFIISPPELFQEGRLRVRLVVSLADGSRIERSHQLLGPTTTSAAPTQK